MLKKFTLILLIVIAAVCIPVVSTASSYKDQIDSLSNKFDALEKQQAAINAEINKAKTEKEKMLAQKKQLDTQISNTRKQISLLTEKIKLLEKSLEAKINEVANKSEEIEVNLGEFKDRLRAMYMQPKDSSLTLLLGSDNFTEFLTSVEYASRMATRDKELLDDMKTELSSLQEDQAEIESNKKEIEESKAIVATKEAELGVQVKSVESEIQDISQLEAEFKANKSKIEKEMQQVQSEIDKIYANAGASNPDYAGGSMAWPVPKHTYVSSNYGWRFNNTDFHTGFDIAGTGSDGRGIYGKPIVSANAGKVIFTQTSYVPGRGYGIYVIVDHGGGISTLYGHTSKLAVRVGDYVQKGQTIAYVGSTGWSTGPHLHFEVRKDGKYVNPWGYISRP